MKISHFAVDKTKVESGVWVNAGGLSLLIARAGNPKYEEFILREGQPFGIAARQGLVPPEQFQEMTMRAVAAHILLDWKDMEDEDGKPIPYSKEKAYELFKTYNEFYKMVIAYASDISLYRLTAREEARGNSLNTSAG